MSDDILARLGVPRAEVEAIARAAQTDGDLARAAALVSPELLRLGVAGDARSLISRLEELVAAGARHLSFGPPLGPEPLQAITLLGREILPYFRR
jgi:5,10-methylenetetrahydromethanopterin reductase